MAEILKDLDKALFLMDRDDLSFFAGSVFPSLNNQNTPLCLSLIPID
jgi:hypothetical protein